MNEIKPEISIFGTAHRPENWMDLYKSIGDNDISFEIIFVGPNEPDFDLPSNFKFIKSYTKPTQCLEIASRNATADLIMNIADDMEFRTKRPLDILYNSYKSHNNNKLILSCRYMLNGKDESDTSHRFFVHDKSSPIMPLSGLMSQKFYKDIGGIDINFIAVMWDVDIAMRVYALGGEVILSDVYLDEIKSKSCGSNLCGDYWEHDRVLVESLWSKRRSLWSRMIKSLFIQRDFGDSLLSRGSLSKRLGILLSPEKKTHFNRSHPVEPFSDLRILEESQGPKGRWI